MLSQKKSMLLLMLSFILLSLCLVFLARTASSSTPLVKTPEKPAPTLNAQGVYEYQITMGEPAKLFVARNEALLDKANPVRGLFSGHLGLPMEKRNQLQVEVKLKDDDRSLVFKNNVIDIHAMSDSSYPKQGMTDMTISIWNKDTKLSDYQQYQAIISQLKQQGWLSYIPPMVVRVFGQNSYSKHEGLYVTADPYYLDSVDKWQRYNENARSWLFYKKGVHLRLSYGENNLYEFESHRNKVFRITILTDFSMYFYDSSEDHTIRDAQYGMLIKQQKEEWVESRYKNETMARSLGIVINEDYVDPPIPDKFDLSE